MKKKGFTLIELLAVIVILAIIALIATPIVMNVIENSKKGAVERGAENYKNAVETAIMEARLDEIIISDGTYSLADLKTKVGEIEVNGTKATKGTIVIKDGQVQDASTFTLNGRVVNIVDSVGKVGDFGTPVSDIKGQTEVIKYDPVTNSKCTSGTTCYKWYVLEDKGSEYAYVSLIMNKNLGDTVVGWCKDEKLCKTDGNWDNTKGPITAMNYLKQQTNNWTVEANLPTAEQIAAATGQKFNNSMVDDLELWLYANIKGYPDEYGYWTVSAQKYTRNYARTVDINGRLYSDYIYDGVNYGVRPVITILKTNLID